MLPLPPLPLRRPTEGSGQGEAWYRATSQAEAVGMLARPQGGEGRWHGRLTSG
jgi:hypothetical protein